MERLEAERSRPSPTYQVALWQYMEQLQTNVLLAQLIELQGGKPIIDDRLEFLSEARRLYDQTFGRPPGGTDKSPPSRSAESLLE